MSWLELVLLIGGKVSNFAEFIFVMSLISIFAMLFVLVIAKINSKNYEQKQKRNAAYEGYPNEWLSVESALSPAIRIALMVLFLAAPFALIPKVDDIWKVRIALIKIHLASPENIQKGADVIERLGKKLECKYLGCDQPNQEAE